MSYATRLQLLRDNDIRSAASPHDPDDRPRIRIRGSEIPVTGFRPTGTSLRLGTLLVGIVLLTTAGPLSAQERQTCGLDFQFGASLPLGEVAETAGLGATFGPSLGCRIAGSLSLEGGFQLGGYPDGPGLVRMLFGPVMALSDPGTEPWVLSARLEGGYTWRFSMGGPSIRFPPSGRPERQHLVPDRGVTGGLGARLSWRPSRFVGLFADAGLRVLFDSSDDLVLEHRMVEGFGWPVTLPLTLGLNVGF